MDSWTYQYPSTVLTRSAIGDQMYADQFRGDADVLLYQLKNLMKFRQLGQLKMTRVFMDGTVITARSVFGHDFLEIDVSRSTFVAGVGVPSCTITFINLPDSVQPMRYPGEIRAGEIEGIDYVRTYYVVNLENCNDCQDVALEFLFNYSTPVESRHFHNAAPIPQMGVAPGGDDPDNHNIYSLEPPSWAEIIGQGSDSEGTYIIWKVYTEMGDVTYSRTGLAIPLLRAIINKADGTELCRQEQKFDVDCCKKDSDLRNVEIWWEGVGICEPFIMYGDTHICKMPASVSTSDLVDYSTPFYAARPLYAIPTIKGGCLPLEWSVSGPIKLINTDPYGSGTYFQMTDGGCNSPVTITLRDRCGKEDIIEGTPCCGTEEPLSISYTSLLMSCSQQQDLHAVGGCSPYTWSKTGGGSIAGSGNSAVYTAPVNNAGCENNDSVSVTDCCGNTSTITIHVSCNPVGNAYEICVQTVTSCSCFEYYGGVCVTCLVQGNVTNTNFDCLGNVISQNVIPVNAICDQSDQCPGCPDDCSLNDCSFAGCVGPCGTYIDLRTVAMKEDGCCPINPLTGLPF